jgi:hypothetical protein
MPPADPKNTRKRAPSSSIALAPRDNERFDPVAANAQKATTLRLTRLRRSARTRGLTIGHSDYGYSLIDRARNRVGGRNDLTLDELEAQLDSAGEPAPGLLR